MTSACTPRFPAPVRLGLLAGTLGVAALLSGCGNGKRPGHPRLPSSSASHQDQDHQEGAPRDEGAREARVPEARLVYTHAGGIGAAGCGHLEADRRGGTGREYNRLSPAGTGATFSWPTGDAFRVFDSGAWTERHGDHGHSYAAEPELTDRAFGRASPATWSGMPARLSFSMTDRAGWRPSRPTDWARCWNPGCRRRPPTPPPLPITALPSSWPTENCW